MFQSQYKTVQVIKQSKSKTTSIVVDKTGKYYISKCLPTHNASTQNQISALQTLRHPNIVTLHDLITEDGKIHLVEQYCEEGDLAYHMRRRNRNKRRYYMEDTVANWVLQVLLALDYMHAKGIIHRGIRPENIFLTAQGNIKLGSLKFSKTLDKQPGLGLAFTLLASSAYSAPECANKTGYTQKIDIWALGCLIQQLCTLKSNNVIQNAQRLIKNQKQALPLIYSAELNEIYMKCLETEPENRPSAKELLANPYFLAYLKNIAQKNEKTQTSQKPKLLEQQTEERKVLRKIPIKKYNIHKENEEKKKIEEFRRLNNLRKESSQKASNYLFKKSSLDQNRMMLPSKEEGPYSIKIKAAQEVEREGRQVVRKSSIDTKKDKDKLPEIKTSITRSKSREIAKRLSINKDEERQQSKLRALPSIEKEAKQTESQSHSSKSGNADINSKQSIESPQKKLAPPKPPRKKSFGGSDQKPNPSSIIKVQQIKMLKAQNLSKSQVRQPKKFEQSIKQSVQKIFDNLLTVKGETYEQQNSFDLSDQDDVRLTSAKDEETDIVDTYKTKLEELKQWMMCKYSPNMQTILERTMEMDSNTFSNMRP